MRGEFGHLDLRLVKNMWRKITPILLLCFLVLDLVLSWRGEGAFSQPATVSINLGYQPHFSTTTTTALQRLAVAVHQNPKAQFFKVRWVDSLFLGWDKEHQIWLEYSRKGGGLCLAGNSPLLNEPSEEWGEVREDLLTDLAKYGFGFLRKAGCHLYTAG